MQGKAIVAVAAGLVGSLVGAPSASAEEADTLLEAMTDGTLLVQARARVERVELAGKRDAEAFTVRSRLGWQTGVWRGLSALGEIEDVSAFGPPDYNSGYNGRTLYAGIADPEGTEVNRLQLTFAPRKGASMTLGRQSILIDDQRFVGESNSRQDAVTYDAARFDLGAHGVKAIYAYAVKAGRTAAEKADWDLDAHLLNVSYKFSDAIAVTGFFYAVDVREIPEAAKDTATTGIRVFGSDKLAGYKIAYLFSAAEQQDYDDNPASVDLGFRSFEGSVSRAGVTAKFGFDSIEGDGVNLFMVPLGSGHSFAGWSDAFALGGAKTTRDGLDDLYGGVVYAPKRAFGVLGQTESTLIHRDFTAERTGRDLGSEWNAQFVVKPRKSLSVGLKWADYDGPDVAPAPADRTKAWLTVEYRR